MIHKCQNMKTELGGFTADKSQKRHPNVEEAELS